MAIRPEKIAISAERPTGPARALAGKVEKAAYLGERSHIYVRTPNAPTQIAVSAQNSPELRDLQSGGQGRDVWLSWTDDALVVLNTD